MGDISAHFDRREFDCHDGSRANPHPALVAALERLRTIIGNRPIRIVSGYRSPAYNRRIGGAKRSQHLYNRAADLPATLGVNEAQAMAAGFVGIGVCRGIVVHVDVRTGRSTPVVFQDC